MIDISTVNGIINQLITRGHHLVHNWLIYGVNVGKLGFIFQHHGSHMGIRYENYCHSLQGG